MISFGRYTEFFRVPGMAAAVLASIIGRIPIGITGLAILLFVQGKSGSFAQAGAASAVYVLGLAVVAPFLGRIIDRAGPRAVLALCSAVYPLALLMLVALVSHAAHPLWVAGCAFTAGAALPPISICMRTLYPRLLHDVDLLHTAYSIDSVLVETIFILGPALIAVFVAAGHTVGAVVLAAVCAAAGGTIFLRSPAIRNWTIRTANAARGKSGLLHYPKLLVVFAATVLYSVAFGLFEVAVTAFAAKKGMPAAAGLTLALASAGSAAGALVYGSRSWPLPLPRQFLTALILMALGILLLAPLTNIHVFALAGILAGAPMATVIAVQSILVSRLAPRGMLAESFTWGATCLLGGVSSGIAAGGMLAEYVAPSWVVVAAAGATLLSCVVVWAGLSPAAVAAAATFTGTEAEK
ncbi:MAG TPA: MFS transporter [Burkholderiales bacterium]|nr:MFS transporter [Burkholderiales bacterium]